MMIIFCAFDLGSCAVLVWNEDTCIRCLGEWIIRQYAEILFKCEDNSQVAMIAASQGGWD